MPELRHDPIQKRWVIIATERRLRPVDFKHKEISTAEGFCPFCEGNESKTPPEISAIRNGTKPNEPGWEVRVVPNKFPALRPVGDLERREEHDFFRKMDGLGVHEVIIESPRHNQSIGTMTYRKVEQVIDLNQFNPRGTHIGWCRGLEIDGDYAYLGFSRLRHTKWEGFVRTTKDVLRGRKRKSHIEKIDMRRKELVDSHDYETYGSGAIFALMNYDRVLGKLPA